MNKILLTCGVILLVVGIIYALTCTKIPKMTFLGKLKELLIDGFI